MKKFWDDNELHSLVVDYPLGCRDHLVTKYGRSWNAIVHQAHRCGIRRSFAVWRHSDLSPLLSNSPIALYWIGFLMADGWFSEPGKIAVDLAIKDKSHLEKFATFIGCANIHEYFNGARWVIYIGVQDRSIVPQIMDKFKISSQKTIHPCDLSSLSPEDLFPLFVGFFDGDGSISKDQRYIRGGIRCHGAWLPNFVYIRRHLSSIIHPGKAQPKLTNRGYANWNFSQNQLHQIKQRAVNLGLPILERKWDRVRLEPEAG